MTRALEGILQELGMGIYNCLWAKDCWGLYVNIILCSCSASSSCGLAGFWSFSPRKQTMCLPSGQASRSRAMGQQLCKARGSCLFTGRGHCSEQVQAADLGRGGKSFVLSTAASQSWVLRGFCVCWHWQSFLGKLYQQPQCILGRESPPENCQGKMSLSVLCFARRSYAALQLFTGSRFASVTDPAWFVRDTKGWI